MKKPGSSSYEVEKQRLEAETTAARERYRRDGDHASLVAWQKALAKETDLQRPWFD